MHSLLKRQLRRFFGDIKPTAEKWQDFMNLVNDAYNQFDADRRMLERSLELNSQELLQANSDIRAVFERIIASSIDGIFAYDKDFRCTVWNPGMERITGTQSVEAVGRPVFDLFPAFRETGDDAFVRESVAGKMTMAKDGSYVIRDTGQLGFFETYFGPLRGESGSVIGGLAIMRDVTERKLAEEALAERAIRDSATDLYSRRYFDYRIAGEIARAQRDKGIMAMLLCQFERTDGADGVPREGLGDDLLWAVAKSIQKSIRGIDLVFRWGGSEIVVVMQSKTRQGVVDMAERIRKGVSNITHTRQHHLDLTIGISLFPDHGKDIEALVRMSDRAIAMARQRGARIHIGEEDSRLDDDAVEPVFHPVMDVTTDRIIGYDARVRDPRGRLTCHDLLKQYESTGQLEEFKEICFLRQLRAAARQGLERVFLHADFKLLDRLEAPDRPDGMDVVLGIPDGETNHDADSRGKIANKWAQRGYRFAIDEFGTGQISLPFLTKVTPDYITLGQPTVRQAVASTKFRRVLKYLILALRDGSKAEIVAQGVENATELEVLKTMEVNLIEGPVTGKPELTDRPGTRASSR